jgi:myosin heavy subunit
LREEVREERGSVADPNYRYKMLTKETWPSYRGSDKDAVAFIMDSLKLASGEAYELGKTKIFIKEPKTVIFRSCEIQKNILCGRALGFGFGKFVNHF